MKLRLDIWLVSLLGVCAAGAKEDPVLASVTWSEDHGFRLVNDVATFENQDTVAVGNFTNAINETGWSYLEIKTDPRFPDNIQVIYFRRAPQ